MKNKEKHYLDELLIRLQMNAKKFSESLGLDRPEKIYRVLRGLNSISGDLANLIVSKYPDINYSWLLTGNGEMLKTVSIIQSGEKSIAVGSVSGGKMENFGNNYNGLTREELILLLNNMAQDYSKNIEERYRHLKYKDAQLQEKDRQIDAANKQIDALIASHDAERQEMRKQMDRLMDMLDKKM